MIIYTCVTNNDTLHPVQETGKHYCYTNRSMSQDGWDCLPLENTEKDNARTARWHKTQADILKNKETIWIDGKVELLQNLYWFYKHLKTYDLVLLKHPKRNCIYEEAKKVIEIGKAPPRLVLEQVEKYQKSNMPSNFGLFETCIIGRKANLPLNDLWWNEIKNHSHRDQISLPFLLYKYEVKTKIIEININDNPYFKIHHHPFKDHSQDILLL